LDPDLGGAESSSKRRLITPGGGLPGYKHIGICNLKIFDPFSLLSFSMRITGSCLGERLASFDGGISAARLAASLRRLMERRGAAMVTPRLIVTRHEEDWFTEMQEEQDALRQDREAARMAAEACWWLQPL
jgi:hypothetical protein